LAETLLIASATADAAAVVVDDIVLTISLGFKVAAMSMDDTDDEDDDTDDEDDDNDASTA
jgi:hypothetical protein